MGKKQISTSDNEAASSDDEQLQNSFQSDAQRQNKRKRPRKNKDEEEHANEDEPEQNDEDEDDEQDLDDEEPMQTHAQKRELRKKYRNLQQNIDENKNDWIKPDSHGLLNAIRDANELFDNVSATQEAYLDSRILASAAKLSILKVNNMKLSGKSLNIDDFLNRVKTRLSAGNQANDNGRGNRNPNEVDSQLNWCALTDLALQCGVYAPAIDFMYGPLAVEPKTRKEAKKNLVRIYKDTKLLQKPQQLKEDDIEKQDNETSKCVTSIYKILRQKGPMNFFEFVVNPGNFGNSVENIFYVAFLIRDGLAAIQIEDDQPILYNSADLIGENGGPAGGILQQKQHIIELTHDLWEEIIQTYGIDESVIPTREQAHASGKW